MSKLEHPMQPLFRDKAERTRFKENSLVRFVVANSTKTVPELLEGPFPQEDKEQFLQLIGCTLDWFLEDENVSYRTKNRVKATSVIDEVEKDHRKVPRFDIYGYPVTQTLVEIRTWNPTDIAGVFNFIESAWNNVGKVTELEGGKIEFVTGGWSGNEDLIAALKENDLIWSLSWLASKRGGYHRFIKYHKNVEKYVSTIVDEKYEKNT